jgi:hypothetical protein
VGDELHVHVALSKNGFVWVSYVADRFGAGNEQEYRSVVSFPGEIDQFLIMTELYQIQRYTTIANI